MATAATIDAGTRPGAETIDLQEGNSHGILLLHGFGDTPQTLALLANHLHERGYDVKAPLLPGHGRTVDAFMASRRKDWLACARHELAILRANHESMSIAGLSMGGAIAAILASENPDAKSLVMIAPYLDMPLTARIASASHWLWGSAAGPRKSTSPRSILDPEERQKNLGYGVYTGRLLYELWRLAAQAHHALASITIPALLIQSREDPRIAPGVAERAYAALGSREKKLTWAEGGGHIITVDFGREKVFEGVERWIEQHSA
ncbi:MAG TPA: alpha/beta fold hydrolase [Gemmatimonadaceae bacterium]